MAKPPLNIPGLPDLSLIKPSVAAPASDKYSRNLYNWMRAHGQRPSYDRVFCYQVDTDWKTFRGFDYRDTFRSDIFLGRPHECDGTPFGSPLRRVLCDDPERYNYVGIRTEHRIDITEWFWTRYIEIGRCLFDPDHRDVMRHTEDRFETINASTRRCRWCGVQQTKREEIITRTVTVWDAAA